VAEHEHHIACSDVVELVTAYFDRALPADLTSLFEEHLNFCDGCVDVRRADAADEGDGGPARGGAHPRAEAGPAWDATIEPSRLEGPALIGFVAARISEELDGVEGYVRERALQAAWLVDRLGLVA
jgi:hypothetical protein